MKKKGKIHHWNTTRGMGFIRNAKTGSDIFFHIKDYRGSASPRDGETVWFDEITSHNTRPRAIEVSTVSGNADVHSHRPRRYIGRKSNTRTLFLLCVLWCVLLAWGVWVARLPLWMVAAALAVNLLTACAYAVDQHTAYAKHWRIPEAALHLLSLLGGWPAAGLAQAILQYRPYKPSFASLYWGTVAVHLAALLGWLLWLQPTLDLP